MVILIHKKSPTIKIHPNDEFNYIKFSLYNIDYKYNNIGYKYNKKVKILIK